MNKKINENEAKYIETLSEKVSKIHNPTVHHKHVTYRSVAVQTSNTELTHDFAPVSSPKSSRTSIVTTKRLHWLERCGIFVKRLTNFTNHGKHTSLPLSKRLFGTALSYCGISFYAAEIFCAASIRAFLENINYTLPNINKKVAEACTPSRSSFGTCLVTEGNQRKKIIHGL